MNQTHTAAAAGIYLPGHGGGVTAQSLFVGGLFAAITPRHCPNMGRDVRRRRSHSHKIDLLESPWRKCRHRRVRATSFARIPFQGVNYFFSSGNNNNNKTSSQRLHDEGVQH